MPNKYVATAATASAGMRTDPHLTLKFPRKWPYCSWEPTLPVNGRYRKQVSLF